MYSHSFEQNKYKSLGESPRTYVNKYFGNDRGLSLQSDVDQGYVEDLASLMPVFNQPNLIEKFMPHTENTKSNQRYIAKYAKSFPHKYYDNTKGHSLQSITQDGGREGYNNYKKRPFRDGYKKLEKKGAIRSGPFKYNRNNYGHSLASITQAGGGMAGLAYSN